MSGWMRDVDAQEIPSTAGFSFTGFLAKPTDVRAWNIQVQWWNLRLLWILGQFQRHRGSTASATAVNSVRGGTAPGWVLAEVRWN